MQMAVTDKVVFIYFTFSDRHYDFLWDGLLMSLHSWESCCKCDTALPDLHCEQSWCVFYMWFSLEKSGHTNHNRSDLQQLEFGLPHLKVNRFYQNLAPPLDLHPLVNIVTAPKMCFQRALVLKGSVANTAADLLIFSVDSSDVPPAKLKLWESSPANNATEPVPSKLYLIFHV